MATAKYIKKTNKEIEAEYAAQAAAYAAQAQKSASNSKKTIDDIYKGYNQDAYVDYMQQKKDLPKDLAKQGISGGASETALLGQNANYNNTRLALAQKESAAQADIQQKADDLVAQNQMSINAQSYADQLANDQYNNTIKQQQIEDKNTSLERHKTAWEQSNLANYNSLGSLKAAKKRVSKSDKAQWRLGLIEDKYQTYKKDWESNIRSNYGSISDLRAARSRVKKSGNHTWKISDLNAEINRRKALGKK